MTNFARQLWRDRFKRYLLLSLVVVGIIVFFAGAGGAEPEDGGDLYEVHFFYLTGCTHCDEQKPFNEHLANEYPSVAVIYRDALEPEGMALLSQMLEERGVSEEAFFPVTIFGNQVFMDWDSEETTGVEMEEALRQCLAGNCPGSSVREPEDEVTVPIIGTIVPAEYSLPALAAVLGLVDGFNPCAMWVLAYLISLVITLRDRRRIWLVVGSFVLASGILYYLFMTVWLNAFLFIGYVRPLTIAVGVVALWAGIVELKEFVQTKGAVVCQVQDEESRKKTMSRIERVVFSPLTMGTVLGIVGLAFVVNSIEFVCSAAVPAIFTHVLSLHDLTNLQYYGYILLYVVCFMLDDAVIFSSVAFAMTSALGDKYAKFCRPVGGTIMMVLGALLLFAPDLLR